MSTCIDNHLALFFGGVRRGDYETLIKRGIEVAVIVDNSWPFSLSECKDFKYIKYLTTGDINRLPVDELHKLSIQAESSAIMNVVEPFVVTSAATIKEMGMLGTSVDSAKSCLDKHIMRQKFGMFIGNHANPQFKLVNDEADLIGFFHTVNGPIILKPTNLYGSKFVSFNRTEFELRENYRKLLPALEDYFSRFENYQNPGVIAEEYIEGTNHSIDCVIDQYGEIYSTPIVDVLTGRDIGKTDFHHFARILPSKTTQLEQKGLTELAMAGIKALGLSGCVAHVELIQSPTGPKLLEIAARPGGNRAHMLLQSMGIDLMYAYYQVVTGKTPDLTPVKNKPFAMVSPFPYQKGVLTKINQEYITGLKSYLSHQVKAMPGTIIGPAIEGFFPPMSIELQSSDLVQIHYDIMQLEKLDNLFVLR